ncbi:ABC transporter ATP-binding protein [soil metagenome]
MKNSQSSPTRRTLYWFWRFTRPDKRLFWAGTLGAAFAVLVQDILPPLVVAYTLNHLQELYASNQSIAFIDVRTYLFAYVGLIATGFVAWRLQVIAVWIYETRAQQRAMEHIFDHVQKQGSQFHADRFGGALVSQANKFVGGYERLADEITWSITTGVVAFLVSMTILFVTSPQYAAVLLLVSIIYFTVMFRRIRKQLPFDKAKATSESDRTAKIADNVTNVATVRAFAGEPLENRLFHKQTDETKATTFNLAWVSLTNDTISHIGTASISILAFGGSLVAISVFNAPLGVLYLNITYTLALSRRLWEFTRVLRNINRSLGDASDMTKILDLEAEIKDAPDAKPLIAHKGAISFKDVTFRYKDGNGTPVFENLNFDISAGQKVGLVGPSGGGKTTITKLIMRFMDIDKGEITIDGQNIAAVRLADLRHSLTSVPQDPLLFHRSIADNISYGNPSASQSDIESAARMAHAAEFIKDLPDGYNTLVGERGVKLSGGQRQRIAIARALLRQAPILLLDEATSALDSESEKLIQDALWRLMENRTAVVIAHRLSTIHHMDRILVIDRGKIVEDGTHHKLLKQKGLYARLWAHQSGGFLNE